MAHSIMPDPSKAKVPHYVLVYTDGADGSEREFRAVNDQQAIQVCNASHPEGNWVLYRRDQGQRIPVCTAAPECPPIDLSNESMSDQFLG